MDEQLKEIERDIVGEIWTSGEAMRNLITMCDDFGSRFAGTEGEKQARDFMNRKLKEYGLENVQSEPFEYTGWTRGRCDFEALQPVQRELDAISLVLSPATPADGIEGEVIDLGSGTPDEFEAKRDRIGGKIVLCSSETPREIKRWIHRREKYGRSVDLGAIAFIFMNHVPGELPATGSLRPNMAGEIPGISVSKETGSYLKRLMQKGTLRVRIFMDNVIKPTTSWNVTGEITGTKYPDEIIVSGAHFDGHDISQGAMDDASGACTVMEAARVLARHKGHFKRTMRFICFAVEEFGVTGSARYVDLHKEEMDRINLMINCDSAGAPGRKYFKVQAFEELVPYFKEISKRIDYPMRVENDLTTASDNFPFFMEGVPAVCLYRRAEQRGRGFGHTKADTVDKVDNRYLKEAAIVLSQSLLRIANEEERMSRRRSREEIKKILQERGMEETLRIQKKWPF